MRDDKDLDACPLCLLDNIRLSNGNEGLKNYFHSLLQQDSNQALEQINHQNLKFGTLYLLRHEFLNTPLPSGLNPLYRRALDITVSLLGPPSAQIAEEMRSGGSDTASVLRWMLRTGYQEDAFGTGYDQLLERAAALLAISFRDTVTLPEIAAMIFSRNRQGKLIHELVWAFFEAHSPESLFLLAQYYRSSDSRDVALAKKLLAFVPATDERSGVPADLLYDRAMQWFEDYLPFLFYTGESMQMSNKPLYYAVSWFSRYLCRSVSAGDDADPALDDFGNSLRLQFNGLPETIQQQLADLSYRLYKTNIGQWQTWIRQSPETNAHRMLQWTGGLG